MKKNIFIFLCGLSFCLVSCSDSFFDMKPSTSVSTDVIYKTSSDFNIAVIGCYSKLQTQVDFYTECCEYRSDNLSLSAPTSGTQDRYDIDHFVEKQSNGILDDYWGNFSNSVYRCNMILDKIDAASFDEKLKQQYKGETLFIRAFTYFNMYRIWGGVPIARNVVDVEEALKTPRATDEQMLKYIAGDLQQILDENMLPEKHKDENIGRITLGAVRTLLGKVYLTFHKWNQAKEVLSEVLGNYQLVKPIQRVFDVHNKMNGELIFVVRFNKEVEGEGHGYWYNLTNLTDDSNQSESLINCFEDGDARKELIQYVKADKNVCLMNKFFDTKSSTYNVVGNDQIILRYADVLLMYAEALNEISYDASVNSIALNCINEVRRRSGLSDLSEIANQDDFRKAILDERQREFPYEGHRWFDLVRMGYAKEVMSKEGVDLQDYQMLFPIPQKEIEKINDSSILWQNPGYNNAN